MNAITQEDPSSSAAAADVDSSLATAWPWSAGAMGIPVSIAIWFSCVVYGLGAMLCYSSLSFRSRARWPAVFSISNNSANPSNTTNSSSKWPRRLRAARYLACAAAASLLLWPLLLTWETSYWMAREGWRTWSLRQRIRALVTWNGGLHHDLAPYELVIPAAET